MPRPARAIWVKKSYARRRHRSWMMAMTLASLGWGTWWVALFVHRVAPGLRFGLGVPSAISIVFAVCGLFFVLVTVRAKRSWLLLTLVPFLANASLLFVPWMAREWANPG